MGQVALARVKPNRMKWPPILLHKLVSNHCESRQMFLHASYRNTRVDWKVFPDKIDGSGQR